jgi:hypothetical protein
MPPAKVALLPVWVADDGPEGAVSRARRSSHGGGDTTPITTKAANTLHQSPRDDSASDLSSAVDGADPAAAVAAGASDDLLVSCKLSSQFHIQVIFVASLLA